MSVAIMLAFTLVAVTFLLHYRALLWLGYRTPHFGLSTQAQVLVILVALFLVRLVEIGIYAITYGLSVSLLGLGQFQGAVTSDAMSYLYYSGVIYMNLGLGDIQPQGMMQMTAHMLHIDISQVIWTMSWSGFLVGLLSWCVFSGGSGFGLQ